MVRSTSLVALVALAGCASYTPPPGYTEAQVNECERDYYLQAAATLPAALVPVVGGGLASLATPERDKAMNACLASETREQKDAAFYRWFRSLPSGAPAAP